MKKIQKTIILSIISIIIILSSVPCTVHGIDNDSALMDYKLYCNGYQIDISQYPLLNVYGESGEPDIVYISEKNYSVMEILGLYIDYNEFYTRDYLEKSDEWISRAELEAKRNKDGVYPHIVYDAKKRGFRVSNLKYTYYIKTAISGNDAYVLKSSLYKNVSNSGTVSDARMERMMGTDIDGYDISDYTSEFSFKPIIEPEYDEDFLPKGDVLNKTYELYKIEGEKITKDGKAVGEEDFIGMSLYDGNGVDYWRDAYSWYLPLQFTYETLGFAVIFDTANKTVFIYSKEYLEKNRGWITVERAVKLASVFSKAKKDDIDVQYDKDGGQLVMKNGGSTVAPPVKAVALPVVVFDDVAYVKIGRAHV